MLNQKTVKELMHYCPKTGVFTWKKRKEKNNWNSRYAGKVVGCMSPEGYLVTSIYNKSYRLHVIAWLYVTGLMPEKVDHKNRIKSDNRFLNLRVCNPSQSAHNTGLKPNNKSGYKGVRWNKQCKKWQAVVKLKYKQYHAGLFDCSYDAALAYDKKAKELHGDFAHTNKMLGLL